MRETVITSCTWVEIHTLLCLLLRNSTKSELNNWVKKKTPRISDTVLNRKKTLEKGKWIYPCCCRLVIGITPIDGSCYKIINLSVLPETFSLCNTEKTVEIKINKNRVRRSAAWSHQRIQRAATNIVITEKKEKQVLHEGDIFKRKWSQMNFDVNL